MPLRIASRLPRCGLLFAGLSAGGCCAPTATQAANRTRTPNAERRTRFRLDMRGIVARPTTPQSRTDNKAGRQRAGRQEFLPSCLPALNSCLAAFLPSCLRSRPSYPPTYCTFADTDAAPLIVNVHDFRLAPPLEHAPDQIASRPFETVSVIAVPVVNGADPELPTATLMPAGLDVTRSPFRPLAETVSVAV